MNKKKITMLSGIAALAIMASGAAIAITSIQDMGLAQAQEKQTTGFKANWSKNEPTKLTTQASDPRYKEVTANCFYVLNEECFQIGGDNGFLIQNLEKMKITFTEEVSKESFTKMVINQTDIDLNSLTISGNTLETGLLNIKNFSEFKLTKSSTAFTMTAIEFTYSCQ